MVYGVLGRMLWKGGLREAEVVILHRGIPDDRKTLPGASITSVKKGYITYDDSVGRETVIPLHRILEVRVDGKTIWKRTGKV